MAAVQRLEGGRVAADRGAYQGVVVVNCRCVGGHQSGHDGGQHGSWMRRTAPGFGARQLPASRTPHARRLPAPWPSYTVRIRSEEHTSELQYLMTTSFAVFS